MDREQGMRIESRYFDPRLAPSQKRDRRQAHTRASREKLANMPNVLPEAFRLHEVLWQLFVTLTFKSPRIPASRRKAMIYAWYRQIATKRIHLRKLLFCHRLELGASNEHPHYHVLLGGLGDLPPGFTIFAGDAWKERGGGRFDICKFDPSLGGVDYVLKLLPCYGKSERIRDDETSMPTLSRSVFAFLRQRRIR